MPYENDKTRENRSDGKKSVTKRNGSTSTSAGRQPTTSSRSQSAKTGTGTKSTSSSSRTTQQKPKTSSTAQSKPKTSGTTQQKPKASSTTQHKPKTSGTTQQKTKTSGTSQSKPKSTGETRSRQSSTAREDYKRFSEETKKKTQTERKTQTGRTRNNGRGNSTSGRKSKAQSRSKLMSVLTYIMIVFAFVALMVALSLTVFFKVDSIKVSIKGTEYYSGESVIELSGIEEGQNIFSIDLDEIEEKIEKEMPYIEECEIKRSLPTGIKINITGAQPVGMVTLQSGVRIIVSVEGKSLEMLAPDDGSVASDTDTAVTSATDVSGTDTILAQSVGMLRHSIYIDESSLPEIVGLQVSGGMEPGEYIEISDETALTTLKHLTELLEKYELPPKKIDLSAGKLFVYYDDRIVIKLGAGTDLETKIEMANDIIKNKLSEYDSGRVDVTNPQKGYFTPEYVLKQAV